MEQQLVLILLHMFDSLVVFPSVLIGYRSRYIEAVETLTEYTPMKSAVFNDTCKPHLYATTRCMYVMHSLI